MDSLVDRQTSLLEDPLLQNEGTEQQYYTGDGSIDIRGRPVLKTKTGEWKACSFILGSFFCERLAFYGVSTNLVNYLIEKLHQGNVSAARNVTTWQGTCYLTPLIGAILADTYFGRYWTIASFITVYLLGTCALTLSASIHSLKPAECTGFICPSATPAQYAVFFSGLYLIALGTGGLKPCIWPFGADQFDDTDKTERTKKGTYFNLFYFSQNIGAIIASTLLVWIQDDVGWGIGFGVSALLIGLAFASLFSGTFLYRLQRPGGSPLTRICQVLVAAFHKRKLNSTENCGVLYETEGSSSAIKGSRKLDHTNELRCLDKAALVSENEESNDPWRLCTVTQVEEVKILARMVPILATGIVFSAVFAQMPTLFVEQGKAMDRRVIGSFTVPAASLSLFNHVTVVVLVPIYDRLIVPAARRHTGRERGFSQLQRMGAGLFVSILCMSAAAALEAWCLKVAGSHAQVSILWQVPQYFLLGSAEVFTFVGQHEFFYEQAPDAMRSLCSALSLLTNSLGNYLSSTLITAVTYATSSGGSTGWIPDDLDHGHLDYFFWLLAALSAVNLLLYLVFASKYEEKKTSS